jgi:hypothetical protein
MRALGALSLAVTLVGLAQAQEITPPPPAPQGQSGAMLLPALIEHSLHYATLEDGRISGEGADFLRQLGQNAHFILLGEDHGNAGIANFATAYWRELNAVGYQHVAVEIDPYLAANAERELRAGGVPQWTRYLASHGGSAGAPFFGWTAEAELLNTVVQTSAARRSPAIWGLDQVFNGSAPARLRDIADGARNREARLIAAELAASGEGDWTNDWFATVTLERLQRLRSHLNSARDRSWAEMADALIVSRRIYAPFMARSGEAYLANHERETLMKRNFLRYYEAALRAERAPPRVMLKFGAYHMTRGATPTWVQGLGGFVTEFAVAHDMNATTISLWCGPGGRIHAQPEPVQCDEPVAEHFPFLTPYIDRERVTIIDCRVWRLRPSRWQHLAPEIKSLIGSYDVVVFIPNGQEATFLDGVGP